MLNATIKNSRIPNMISLTSASKTFFEINRYTNAKVTPNTMKNGIVIMNIILAPWSVLDIENVMKKVKNPDRIKVQNL